MSVLGNLCGFWDCVYCLSLILRDTLIVQCECVCVCVTVCVCKFL